MHCPLSGLTKQRHGLENPDAWRHSAGGDLGRGQAGAGREQIKPWSQPHVHGSEVAQHYPLERERGVGAAQLHLQSKRVRYARETEFSVLHDGLLRPFHRAFRTGAPT